MAKRLIWTPEARWWLREIYDYISRDRPDAAHKVVRGIFDRAHLLLEFPEMGHLHSPRRHPGVRILLYGKYRIAYLNRENIYVLGVFHGALDLKRHLSLKEPDA